MMKSLPKLLVILLFFSCGKENSVLIDNDLQSYFDSFVEEAASRNVLVDFESMGMEAKISNIETGQVAGQCSTRKDGSRLIVIDEQFWNTYSQKQKEYLVFHELGHCYLNRSHNDDVDDTGKCVSIMHSSGDVCDIIFNTSKRSNYLDELFTN